ncbi:gas vesicle protein GvpG [Endozoicomonas sp. SM1973]|uniref:Gas vesicle protein GvpG n=1 Tax=Spartinivicinus marinus TaxID=2994442 RepID=A0A853I5U0_9GAMM|nr:gas vesicle protein GvpG [Spartinivicinus marinus]MCX4028913.1 gas vesicle protein GvpG [Spartinivicinus marinus]NYZ65504.1 gas vesicle protein GvpG [Spartinivicinus marinus]
MFLIDDLLLAPYKGVKWIFKEIYRLTQEELESESEQITQALTELYRKLESGEIAEEQFDEEEQVLLDRLDEIEALLHPDEEEDSELDDEFDRNTAITEEQTLVKDEK